MKCFVSAVLLCAMALCAGCSDSSDNKTESSSCELISAQALIMVVENSDNVGSVVSGLYSTRKSAMLDIFSALFGVSTAVLGSLSVEEIIDQYGEDWQISEITKAASGYYSRIISLTDGSATFEGFMNALREVSSQGMTADIIFNLHGSTGSVLFYDRSVPISEITGSITSGSIPVRTLYQTCCHGGSMIYSWEGTGITAVSGAPGVNELSMFSPVYFMQNWVLGQTFKAAVKNAYEMEKQKLLSYSSTVPEFSMMITDANLIGSLQDTGGCNESLDW